MIEETLDHMETYLDYMMTHSDTCTDTEEDAQSQSTMTAQEEQEEWVSTLDEQDLIEIEIMINETADEYLQNEIEMMSKPEFHDMLIQTVNTIVYAQLLDMKLCTEDHVDEVYEYIKITCNAMFENGFHIPPRSYENTFKNVPLSETEMTKIAHKIEELKNVYQPKQKTPEWYEFRHKIITASNLWKLLGSELQMNNLIYEKCQPLNMQQTDYYSNNLKSSLHWGVKYELVTLAIYEDMYKTKVGDFGCIVHKDYPFIGASPDGINIDPHSGRYGRMLEIKNIFNREINGIPKEEYWIQMQIQMETCDLDECDFMETRFKECENEDQFYNNEVLHDYRGVILHFVEKPTQEKPANYGPYYRYMPLSIPVEKEAVDEWIQKTRDELHETHVLYEAQYWYLEEMSCVLVKRNREWFKAIVPKIQNTWNIIEKERVEGYEHRAPKKKITKTEVVHDNTTNNQVIFNMPETNRVCLVKLDEDGNAI
jgi:putative phage-type endonuclease